MPAPMMKKPPLRCRVLHWLGIVSPTGHFWCNLRRGGDMMRFCPRCPERVDIGTLIAQGFVQGADSIDSASRESARRMAEDVKRRLDNGPYV